MEEIDNVNQEQFARKRVKEALEKKKAEDIKNLVMTVALEARGEGEEGMFAVAKSIINRHNMINSGEVPPYTFNVKTKKPTFLDIISADKQYAVYDEKNKKFKKQKSPVTSDDLSLAKAMVDLASNDELTDIFIQATGLPSEVKEVTGFRNINAEYDPSQDVGTFVIGNHQFNLAGVPEAEE